MFPGWVWIGTLLASSRIGVLGTVMSKAVAIGALSEPVEMETSFRSVGGRKGHQLLANKVGSLGTAEGNNYGGSLVSGSCSLGSEPSGGSH